MSDVETKEFKLAKINDEKVKPIKPLKEPDLRPVKGSKLFAECNASIFVCASRGSGKTSVVGKVMKDCIGPETKIYVFCANLDKDKSWIALQNYFEDRGYDFTGFTSITDPESGENMLQALNYEIQERAREARLEAQLAEQIQNGEVDLNDGMMARKNGYLWDKMFGSVSEGDGEDDDTEKKKKKKEKYRSPEYLIVFDDLSDEIRNSREVAKLLKNGRHFAKVVISSQYLKDLRPEARTNIDYFILFKGLDKKTLEEVFRNAKLSVTFPAFESLYKDATSEKYSFLYIDTRENKFRKNFDSQYEVPDT